MQIASSVTFDAGEAFAFSEGRREGDFSEAMGKVVAACLFLALILYAIKKSQAKKGEAA